MGHVTRGRQWSAHRSPPLTSSSVGATGRSSSSSQREAPGFVTTQRACTVKSFWSCSTFPASSEDNKQNEDTSKGTRLPPSVWEQTPESGLKYVGRRTMFSRPWKLFCCHGLRVYWKAPLPATSWEKFKKHLIGSLRVCVCVCALDWQSAGSFPSLAGNKSSLMPASLTFSSPRRLAVPNP